jgi:hypothetical protein
MSSPNTAFQASLDRRRKTDLVAQAQRHLDRPRLVAKFHALGPRFSVELFAHLDREHGVGDELDAAIGDVLGLPTLDPAPAAPGRGDLAIRRQIEQHRLQQQQRVVALHRRGAGALAAIIEDLDPQALEASDRFMVRALALSPEAIRATRADRLAASPIRQVDFAMFETERKNGEVTAPRAQWRWPVTAAARSPVDRGP